MVDSIPVFFKKVLGLLTMNIFTFLWEYLVDMVKV